MKNQTLPLIAALLGPALLFTTMAGAAPEREDMTKVYEAGRAAFNKGDLVKAKAAFAKVLRAKPDFDLAQIYMAQIKHAEAKWEARPRSQKIAEQARVQAVDFTGVPLSDALEVARRELERAGGGEKAGTISLLADLPAEIADRPVTLAVRNLPMERFLEAVGFAGGVRIAWHAQGLSVTPHQAGPDKNDPVAAAAVKSMRDAATAQLIPVIKMEDVPLAEAIQWLQSKADPARGPLIVVRGPLPPAKINLELRNSSIPDALNSIAIIADLEVSWHAWGAGLAAKPTLAVSTVEAGKS